MIDCGIVSRIYGGGTAALARGRVSSLSMEFCSAAYRESVAAMILADLYKGPPLEALCTLVFSARSGDVAASDSIMLVARGGTRNFAHGDLVGSSDVSRVIPG